MKTSDDMITAPAAQASLEVHSNRRLPFIPFNSHVNDGACDIIISPPNLSSHVKIANLMC